MLHKDSDKLKELIKAFQSAEQQVKSVILNTKAKDIKEYQLRVDKRLDRVNIDLTRKSIDWAEKDMPVAYKDGVKSVDSGYTKAKIDKNEVEGTYIQLAQYIQHATDNQKQNIRNAIDRAEKENSYGATVGNVKDIIQEELAKDNPAMVVTYSNGAKMPLSAHAEMLARTSRIIAENQGAFARCGELGLDLVRCTTVPNCCPYCKKYEGKVYSLTGKDKRFPALYETALQRGYDIMHPNCRHEFIPFVEDFETKENLDKLIEKSNEKTEYNINDKIFEKYKKDQALHKQWIAEHREYDRLKEKLGDKMPYTTLAGFRRARRSNSEEYQRTIKLAKPLIKEQKIAENVDNSVKWNIINNKQYTDKVNKFIGNKKVANSILNQSIKILRHRDKTNKEDLYLIDARTGKNIFSITNTVEEKGIKNTTQTIEVLGKLKENSCVMIHNHPTSSPPSIADINALVENRAIDYGIIAGHNGTMFKYTKPNKKINEFEFAVLLKKNSKKYRNNYTLAHIDSLKELEKEYDFKMEIIIDNT